MEFSLGLIEVSALGNAIFVLDAMTKAADVEFVATERKLGGRLVTLVVKGSVSSVQAAVDAGVNVAKQHQCLKAAEVIARPHPEILKFLHLEEQAPEKEIPAKPTDAPKKTGSKAEKSAIDKKVSAKRTSKKK